MNKTLPVFLLMIALTMNACTPQVTAAPTSLSDAAPTAAAAPIETTAPAATPNPYPVSPVEATAPAVNPIPYPVPPTAVDQSAAPKQYSNRAFGLSFQYPANWFGPDEYVSGQTLRVAVGSDKVSPYGSDQLEQPSTVTNSYLIVIQYTQNDQNLVWKDTYQALATLKDGESVSGARSLITRVRQLAIGKLKGFEYIATLSATAQTDHVYSREVILMDEQSNVLTISGTPNNVEVPSGADWREVFRSLDEANQSIFHEILASLTIK